MHPPKKRIRGLACISVGLIAGAVMVENFWPFAPEVNPGSVSVSPANPEAPPRMAAAETGESGVAVPDIFSPHTWEPPLPPAPRAIPPPPQPPTLPFRLIGQIDDPDVGPTFLVAYQGQMLALNKKTEIDGDYRFDEFANGQLYFLYIPMHATQTLAVGNRP